MKKATRRKLGLKDEDRIQCKYLPRWQDVKAVKKFVLYQEKLQSEQWKINAVKLKNAED